MFAVSLASQIDFQGWRDAAREHCRAGHAPSRLVWQVQGQGADLFAGSDAPSEQTKRASDVSVPSEFLPLAKRVVHHSDSRRFGVLYRLLFRLQKDPYLLKKRTDPDVDLVRSWEKNIRRDIHKMHAFVRFRKGADAENGREQFAAWFEPEHYIEPLAVPFFMRRFPNMNWVIVTPHLTSVWDGNSLQFREGGQKSDVPEDDEVEDIWRAYFSSIFNPARVKISAMTSEMPRKYWKNLPEATVIEGLIQKAGTRVQSMGENAVTTENARASKWGLQLVKSQSDDAFETLDALKRGLQSCTRCPLHCHASQAVCGEGPEQATLMIVGEQPGDREDIAGRPFIGPAGQLLDRALKEAGISRDRTYITNSVKHFKHELKGKRRLHVRPSNEEIDICRWWLRQEIEFVKPEVILGLGATSVRALTGQGRPLKDVRGRDQTDTESGATLTFTVHPSYLLRLPDRQTADVQYARFVEDLRRVQTRVDLA